MEELTVANVDAHVSGSVYAGAGTVKEDQIAGLKGVLGNGHAVFQLLGGGAVDGIL